MSKSDNVVNELLGAIDTVISKRLEQLSYDKTIICTIVDNSNAKNGEYQVTDGSTKFKAQSENVNYHIDDQVRVSVPNGDTTQEKFIIGKYVKDNSTTPITYMTPLSSVLKMSGHICDTQDSEVYGLAATGPNHGVPTKTGALLWTADIDSDDAAMASSQIYDVIYVQADFKTILSNYNITSGTYGLMLSLGTVLPDGNPGPAITCLFDSTQMMGNPYAFGIYTTQAAKFDITNVGKLSSIQLLFYQDGNFTHNTYSADLENIPSTNGINNILVKNIKIGFGANVANIADETVKLFTTDDMRYDNDSTTSTITNEKHLKLAWYNKDENGQYIGFDDGKDANGDIKWVDEDAYLNAAGQNAKLSAQRNYDIPMDENGLALAAETRTIKETLLQVSKSLSTDLHSLLLNLLSRCDIAAAQDYLEEIDEYICMQPISIHEQNTLQAAVNDYYSWYINALNQAAAIHNKDILPTQVSGSWTFKGDGTNPGADPGYYNAFTTFFTNLKNSFYDNSNVFLPELYSLVTGNYTGYKGIYDDAKRKISTLLNDLEEKWNLALMALEDNATTVAQYFIPEYQIDVWEEVDTSIYDNGYAVYWYRYQPDSLGDSFAGRGWARINTATNNINGITITCDAEHTEKEEFKVVIIYNHEKYESNVLTFTNSSPVVNAATAILSDGISIHHGSNSLESYQSYSVANTLVNGADRYTKRELSVNFTHNDGAIDNEALVNAQIYWYIPTNATMLDYDLTDLKSLNTSNDFVNDITSLSHSEMYKEGYVCFYKTIGYGLTADNIADYIKDLKFCYRIKNYYTPTAAQNTIYCTVVKNDIKYHSEILMTFSSYGTSGTDYTLVVSSATKQAAITPSNSGDNAWKLNIDLYDNTNTPVSDFTVVVKRKNLKSRYTVSLPERRESGYEVAVSCGESGETCDILEVSANGVQHNDNAINLTAFFPIPYAANTDYYIEGASTVIYDSQGGNPSYFKQPYTLFQQIPPSGEGTGGIVSGTWSIEYTNSPDAKVLAYLPTLSKGTLLPANMWVDGGDITYDAEKNATLHIPYVLCKIGEDVVWSQPILIIQNRYPSPMLNAWDGKFTIDEKNGTILSTMVSAGRKNKDNQFEGVLMGDIEAGANFNPDNKSGLGIYGFNAGAQSFGFNIDGTAFLGKSGRGRILFDGNSGSISSASYEQNRLPVYEEDGVTIKHYQDVGTAGMKIDLDDGYIDMLGTTYLDAEGKYASNGTKSQIHLDVKSPYFYIKSQDGNELIHIGDDGDDLTPNYFLQTNDYFESTLWDADGNFNPIESEGEDDESVGVPGAGMKLNLAEGKIQAYDFELRGEDSRLITDENGNSAYTDTLGSYLYLSSKPEEMIRVRYRNKNFDTNGIDVLSVGSSSYVLRSFNWWDTDNGRDSDKIEPLTGMKIDLEEGTIEAYAENADKPLNWFRIDASDNSVVPLAIGDRNTPAFKVHWDGSFGVSETNETTYAFKVDNAGNLSLGSGKFKVDAKGNLTIAGDAFSVTNTGNLSLGKGMFKVDSSGNLSLGQRTIGEGSTAAVFFVSKDGELTINGTAFTISAVGALSIGGGALTIDETGNLAVQDTAFQVSSEGNLSLGNGSFSVDKEGNLKINSTAFQVDKNGNLNIGAGSFKVDQNGNLKINSTAFQVDKDGNLNVGNGSFKVDNNGNLKVNTNKLQIDKDGNFWINGASFDKGKFRVTNDGDMYADGTVVINKGFSIDATNGLKVYCPTSVSSGDVSATAGNYYQGKTEVITLVDQVWALGFRSRVKLVFINGLFAGLGEAEAVSNPELPK